MKNRIIMLAISIIVLLSGCGYSQVDLDEQYQDGYEAGYKDGYEAGKEVGRDDAFESGYEDGFQYAANFILDRMSPEYREKWWEENIKEIEEIGMEY